jgi:hypothetical protein
MRLVKKLACLFERKNKKAIKHLVPLYEVSRPPCPFYGFLTGVTRTTTIAKAMLAYLGILCLPALLNSMVRFQIGKNAPSTIILTTWSNSG